MLDCGTERLLDFLKSKGCQVALADVETDRILVILRGNSTGLCWKLSTVMVETSEICILAIYVP